LQANSLNGDQGRQRQCWAKARKSGNCLDLRKSACKA
jgi:hypothetical protein